MATPIGNLEDITYRAVRVLKEVDFVTCEDTRHSHILMYHYGIDKPLVSYHEHSKLTKIDYILDRIKEGENAALISDAGTPGISDPGGYLVNKAVENEIKVVSIAGPSAVTAILSVCGWETSGFVFLGFLPKKKGRQTLLNRLRNEDRPVVFYESPNRVEKTLEELRQYLSDDVDVVIGRELSKVFEEIIRGKLGYLSLNTNLINKKGEFVICLNLA